MTNATKSEDIMDDLMYCIANDDRSVKEAMGWTPDDTMCCFCCAVIHNSVDAACKLCLQKIAPSIFSDSPTPALSGAREALGWSPQDNSCHFCGVEIPKGNDVTCKSCLEKLEQILPVSHLLGIREKNHADF